MCVGVVGDFQCAGTLVIMGSVYSNNLDLWQGKVCRNALYRRKRNYCITDIIIIDSSSSSSNSSSSSSSKSELS